MPKDGDDIFITGNVELPFQNNDISLSNVRITVTSTGYWTIKKKCDVTLGAGSALIVESGGAVEGTHGNSIDVIGNSGNLLGNGVYNVPRAANDQWWNAGSTSPLPVTLVEFILETLEDRINLEWSTASETNNDYFEVERKMDYDWEPIGQVGGSGSTNEMHYYEFQDFDVNVSKLAYYRLKQVDFDGKEIVSHIIKSEVVVTPGHEYNFVQNGSLVTLNFIDNHKEETIVQVLNANGSVVVEKEYNEITVGQRFEVDLSEFESGWYVVGIIGTDNAHFEKMILVNRFNN